MFVFTRASKCHKYMNLCVHKILLTLRKILRFVHANWKLITLVIFLYFLVHLYLLCVHLKVFLSIFLLKISTSKILTAQESLLLECLFTPFMIRKFSNMRPLSLIYPQWFRKSKKFAHWTLRRGGKRPLLTEVYFNRPGVAGAVL